MGINLDFGKIRYIFIHKNMLREVEVTKAATAIARILIRVSPNSSQY